MNNVSYKKALEKMSWLENEAPELGKKLDAFGRSTILAFLFDQPKEKTMDDIMDVRSHGVYSKKKLKSVV
jgi:hypothetical protein